MSRSAPPAEATASGDEPQPWRSREEARVWKAVARGKRRPGMMPTIRVVVDLNDEQGAWLRQEAMRTSLDYISLVEQLIDERMRSRCAVRRQGRI